MFLVLRISSESLGDLVRVVRLRYDIGHVMNAFVTRNSEAEGPGNISEAFASLFYQKPGITITSNIN